jgi:hypothetical protein
VLRVLVREPPVQFIERSLPCVLGFILRAPDGMVAVSFLVRGFKDKRLSVLFSVALSFFQLVARRRAIWGSKASAVREWICVLDIMCPTLVVE